MTAELVAIHEAIKFTSLHEMVVIYTDSLSACLTLLKNRNTNFHCDEIKNSIKQRRNYFKIVYVPAHIGIPGNEMADTCAKNAISNGNTYIFDYMDKSDILKQQMLVLIEKWQTNYNDKSLTKGIYHYDIQSKVSNKPWFHKHNLSSTQIRIISRLRLNHGFWPECLHKIKLLATPNCDVCHIVANPEHIIFTCSKYNMSRCSYSIFRRYSSLKRILQVNKQDDIIELSKFIINQKITFFKTDN